VCLGRFLVDWLVDRGGCCSTMPGFGLNGGDYVLF